MEGLPQQQQQQLGIGGAEGGAGRPLNLQPMLERLTDSIQELLRDLRPQEQSGSSSSSSGDEQH